MRLASCANWRATTRGFFMIKTKDLDEALAMSGRIPAARKSKGEIRPVLEIPGPPAE